MLAARGGAAATKFSRRPAGRAIQPPLRYPAGVAEHAEWDVAVIGAGPAGLTAALAAAAPRRADPVVIERAAHPRYKTCGGGLIGSSLAVAARQHRRCRPGTDPRGHRHAPRKA